MAKKAYDPNKYTTVKPFGDIGIYPKTSGKNAKVDYTTEGLAYDGKTVQTPPMLEVSLDETLKVVSLVLKKNGYTKVVIRLDELPQTIEKLQSVVDHEDYEKWLAIEKTKDNNSTVTTTALRKELSEKDKRIAELEKRLGGKVTTKEPKEKVNDIFENTVSKKDKKKK